jgi:sarcinarray family protein
MKNIVILLIYLVLIFILIPNCNAAENEYGKAQAWFNDIPATAKNIQLKIGEPALIKVEVESKIDGGVFILLDETGITKAYNLIEGPSQTGDWIDNINININSGWKKTYIWKVTPNGDWKDGTAPINIFVQFSKDATDGQIIRFTIANPYILDEQYSGPAPTRTATDPSSMDQPPSQGSPGFGVVYALLGIAFVVMAGRN